MSTLFRDNIYRTSLRFRLIEKQKWEAPSSIKETCINKGQKEEDCRNYIMVLESYGNKLYACGTHAYSPNCSWRQLENLNVTSYDKGIARCPFSPHANITTLLTDNGQLFVATPTDFSGNDPAILRVDNGNENGRMLRTKQFDSRWLNGPQFVASFENGNFVYFVFREYALEHQNYEKIVYSRIARVCKNDPGGTIFYKENWTSFIKARLICALPGEFPFYFNEVQSVSYSAEESVMYATFTTPINSIHGSAVCGFNISAINSAFAGPFKYQENLTQFWQTTNFQNPQYRAFQECQAASDTGDRRRSATLMESTKYQLMDESVKPMTINPLYYAKLERFTHISIDVIPTKFHENVRILYVATEDGLVKKVSILPRTKEACVIEMWQVEQDSKIKIRQLQYLKETESLYIATDASVLRINAHHCNRHATKASCLNAMDPYCGWDEMIEKCTAAPNGNTLSRYWFQNATECPNLKTTVDGSWSTWSSWTRCKKSDQNSNIEDADSYSAFDTTCLCRTRKCDNPAPSNGGKECSGMNIEITNCTINGGWTDYGYVNYTYLIFKPIIQ